MRAIVVAAAGGPDQLRLAELPAPRPGPGEIQVAVRYAGVNFADTMLRRDAYFIPARFPMVPGVEVAGYVSGVGPQVSGWRDGERIAGVRLDGAGGYAEYTLLDASCAARVPEGLALDRAAALLNQGLTAQGLIEAAPEIGRGASVLVTAAGGGVGGLVLQLARRAGAGRILAAASDPSKIDLAGKLDAVLLDYGDPEWGRAARMASDGGGVDVFIDGVGGEVRATAPRVVAVGGRILFYGAASGASGVDERVLAQVMGKNQSLTGFSVVAAINRDRSWLGRTLEGLFALAMADELAIPINPPIPLARAAEAHAMIEGRGSRGKILLQIQTTEMKP
jgi:NADPH2:quinone reductase